jgi:hypothetical protein
MPEPNTFRECDSTSEINDEWPMDGGRMADTREGGTFESLSLFIVHR